MDYGFTPNDIYNESENKKKNKNERKGLKSLLVVSIVLLCVCTLLFSLCLFFICEYLYPEIIGQWFGSHDDDVKINISTNNVPNETYSSVSDMIAIAEKSVVAIGKTADSTLGSGVVISDGGYIVTNSHVVEGMSEVYVTFIDGKTVKGKVYATDSNTDISIVYVDTDKKLYPATFGTSDLLRKGETVYVSGNPDGYYKWSVTSGIVSYKKRYFTNQGFVYSLIQIDASVNPGNSGGALFNSNGELVGIVNSKIVATNIEGIGFAIPSDTVKSVSEDLIKQKYVSGRPYLDISITQTRYRTGTFTYIYRYVVDADSLDGALVKGDILISVGGKSTDDFTVEEIINGLSVGEKVEIVFERNGVEMTAEVVVEEYKGTK